MAGNKMNTKTKSKEDKSKLSKGVSHGNEEVDEPDFTLLRKPINTSITGFAQARKIFDVATEELKSLLSNECDLIYECKVCRNIFRSLANFISHKRIYCKEKFNMSLHNHFTTSNIFANEISKIKQMEEEYQESLQQKSDSNMENEIDDRVPLTKDLTEIIENINKTKEIQELNINSHEVHLQKIPSSSVAVFQNINFSKEKDFDKMQAQVHELEDILSKDKALLQSDGKFKIISSLESENKSSPENVIQISDDDEDESILICKICDLQFSTQKTLKFHMKYKHLESRLVYPCPDCLEIFSTSWSVYRHLFKVHRKTAAQIRRLRESIQAKAFKMNNPPAFYEKRKNNAKVVTAQKISEEERLDQENQAWMDNMEGDGELPRCGGCGRTFERRAALASHTYTCQPRSRALARRPHENKKIEIQIRKDYNKGPTNINLAAKNIETDDPTFLTDISSSTHKRKPENVKKIDVDEKFSDSVMDIDDHQVDVIGDHQVDVIKADGNTEFESYKPVINLPFSQHVEKSNFIAFKQKIRPDIDVTKYLCKKCDTKCNNIQEICDHMAEHYKWMRYACKLCNFKHYAFEKLPDHVKVVHKLKGDTDFYFSTVKPIDASEALELCETTDELNDENESSDSRRPSRCSSDSSRLSDDSSTSSTRLEIGSRKRKMGQNKNNSKRKKESLVNDDAEELKDDVPIDKVILGDSELTTNIKSFEENSSDMDDNEEKLLKRSGNNSDSSVASRRPVRNKTKPKNEDFEYDLSNLLKKEAQGYRDSQTPTSKLIQNKKKTLQDLQYNYDIINKDHNGALARLSKKSVDISAAHMKLSNFPLYNNQKDRSNVFVIPMLPKGSSKADKISPKKDCNDDLKNMTSQIKQSKSSENAQVLNDEPLQVSNKDAKTIVNEENTNVQNSTSSGNKISSDKSKPMQNDLCETIKTNLNIPAVVPIQFRRESLELIKNPIINKNITDFTKAGMKTKILVIKPINRNKDGITSISTSIKFPTFKLKDPNKSTLTEEKSTDHVVVVKVPKVDCSNVRPAVDTLPKSTDSKVQTEETTNIDSDKNDDLKVIEDLGTNIAADDIKCNDISEDFSTKEVVSEVSEERNGDSNVTSDKFVNKSANS